MSPGAGHSRKMRTAPLGDSDPLAEVADDVEAGNGPVSAEEWQRLDELESEESTAWWRRDAAERGAGGEAPDDEEEGASLDEPELWRRFAHLLPGSTGAA